uniref:G-protein coupled receptors family 1 profile domain-containing protein n=1 Tax=Ciona intestinalis TaxID=7719 RepID=H2XWA6_CIOIN
MCLVASFLLFFRIIAEFIEISHGETSRNVCRYVRAFKSVVHSLVVTCIYLVLWIRQRRFYETPALEYLSTPFVRSMSFFVVIIMAVTNICNIGLYLITRAYTNLTRGCVVEWSSISKLTPGLVLFVSTLTFQLVLLGLLIYPLFHHLKACSGPSNEIPYIKRVTVAAMVAVITDITCGAVTVFALKNTYGSMRQVVYDIDMLILLIAICMSFENWRHRLLP